MTINERKKRILAVGESHNHCHIVIGNKKFEGDTIVVGEEESEDYEECKKELECFIKKADDNPEDAMSYYSKYIEKTKDLKVVRIKHIKEKEWLESEEQLWTGEHHDIILKPGINVKPVLQEVFDPLSKRIERVRE